MAGKYLTAFSSVLLLHVIFCVPSYGQEATQSSDDRVTITPEQTIEILANPGMGWETFQRTSRQDRNLPLWIPSTVHYVRWGWAELEPEPGRIDFALLDRVLNETRSSGQKLAFRVMCCSTTKNEPYHPKWLKQVGGSELLCDDGGFSKYPIPNMDDPVVLDRHLDFIRRLGERYDGHPDIDHVDLGSIGWWGEWHLSGSKNCTLPTLANRKKVVDAYLAAFRKTPLLMLINGEECLRQATENGTGWRADCLGDMGFLKKWSHMKVGYPQWIKEAGVQDVWKTAPVAWETGGDIRHWIALGSSPRTIFNYALALHASYINNKSAPLPDGKDVLPEIQRFLRRLGYRLVLKELTHASESRAGARLDLQMKWQNFGSAPCYQPYRLAYRLSNEAGYAKVIVGQTTVNHWLPGSIDLFTEEFFKEPKDLPPGDIAAVTETITLPGDMPDGVYDLSLAVVGEDASTPVVRLGIKGRSRDGWYPLSEIQVGPKSQAGSATRQPRQRRRTQVSQIEVVEPPLETTSKGHEPVGLMLIIVLALKLPTILVLIWAFRRPEQLFRWGRRYWAAFVITALHILLALLSLSGEKSSLSEMFVAYPLIWSVLLRNRFRRLLSVPTSFWLMDVAICLLLWFEETWVIVDHFSPPLRHYIHYFGFYAGVTATILWLYTHYRFTGLQTFVVGGLWGVLVEQQFAGPKMLASGAIVQALIFGVYIFPVYGLYLAAPRLLFFEEFSRSHRVSRWQGLWLFLTISVLPLVTWAVWSAILDAFQLSRLGVP